MKIVIGPDGAQYPVSPAVQKFLGSLDELALSALVLELASYSAEAMRSLELRARPDAAPVLRHLVADIDAALAGVDLDYQDPFQVDPYGDSLDDGVQAVEEVIDELERHLNTGAREVVQTALQHLLTQLGDVGHEADNGEVLVGVAERACALFGRAAEGHPDPVGLARWVVGFRGKYEGWPPLTVDAVAAALDEPGWAAYRASVEALGDGGQPVDPYRNEVVCMSLELADHDGDVDRAVALLSGSGRPYYGEIVRRLGAAGRDAEVLDWLDRAVAQGNVDLIQREDRAIVDAADATSAYLDAGRGEAALALSRTLFSRALTVAAYQLLCEVARRSGCLEEQRDWALRQASERAASTDGAHLIRLHLSDGDTAGAWEAADTVGAGGAWTQLVDASEDAFPLRAARLCQTHAEERLTTPNSSQYPGIVALFVRARSLFERAGHGSESEANIARLRSRYRVRPALMAEMNRAGFSA